MNRPVTAVWHRHLGFACWLGLSAACASASPPQTQTPSQASPLSYPGTLLAPESLTPNVQWRQRITASWPAGERSFDVVFSKDGNLFQLLGLSPLGMPGFVLRLQDGKISVENHSGQEMPFSARYVLLDAQRVFFPWLPGTKLESGTRQGTLNGEAIRETWRDGKLTQRSFQRLDGKPAGEIVVTYSGWEAGQDAPKNALIVNNWVGYRLQIETLEQSRVE